MAACKPSGSRLNRRTQLLEGLGIRSYGRSYGKSYGKSYGDTGERSAQLKSTNKPSNDKVQEQSKVSVLPLHRS